LKGGLQEFIAPPQQLGSRRRVIQLMIEILESDQLDAPSR
jgi:hypothetical protein